MAPAPPRWWNYVFGSKIHFLCQLLCWEILSSQIYKLIFFWETREGDPSSNRSRILQSTLWKSKDTWLLISRGEGHSQSLRLRHNEPDVLHAGNTVRCMSVKCWMKRVINTRFHLRWPRLQVNTDILKSAQKPGFKICTSPLLISCYFIIDFLLSCLEVL